MNILKFITSPIWIALKTIDGVREFVEDRLADVLDAVQDCEPVDVVEKKLISAGVKAGLVYCCGSCPIDNKVLNIIADSVVEKGINKINPALSKQLRK